MLSSSTSSCASQLQPQIERLSKPRDPKNGASTRPTSPASKDQAADAFKQCIDLVKKHDFANYVSALLMPREVQPHVFALLAFNVELALVRDQIERNAGTTGIFRLQFWRDAISTIYGQSTGPVPRQPVAIALRAFGSSKDVDHLYGLVEARQQTLGDRPFESVNALEQYAEKTIGSMLLLVMKAITPPSEIVSKDAEKASLALGRSLGVMNHVRSTVPLLKRGIVLLPLDLMTIHGLSADNVYSNKSPDGIRRLCKDLCDVSRKSLAEARNLSPHVSRRQALALMSTGASMDHMLKIIRKVEYNLFDLRLQRGHPLLAWTLLARKLCGTY